MGVYMLRNVLKICTSRRSKKSEKGETKEKYTGKSYQTH